MQGSGFRVQGAGFRVQGSGSLVQRFRGGLVFKAHRLLNHSTLGLRVTNKKKKKVPGSFRVAGRAPLGGQEGMFLREFCIDNLPDRIHFIIVMIRWTGLAPWEFEFPFAGSVISTFLEECLILFVVRMGILDFTPKVAWRRGTGVPRS